MRLAFDLDGVLADLGSALTREALRLFPEIARVRPPEPASVAAVPDVSRDEEAIEEPVTGARVPDLTSAQHRILWDEVRQIDNFWETLNEIESGVIRQLWCLARERKWDVVFVTSRPSSTGDSVQVQTQRWLESHGFALPSALVVHGSRGKIADALDLDVLVDDRPENCLDVVLESRARAILVWRDTVAKAPANARRLEIGTVRTVAECLAVLAQVDHPGQTSTGLMVTLRHLLGLKPTRAIAGRRPPSSLVRPRSKP